MASRRAHLRALGYLGRLGDSAVIPPPDNAAPSAWTQITGIPGTSLWDLIENMATGNLTQDQVNAAIGNNAAEYVQAGMSPAAAQAQATSDVNAALSTFTAPGGLDLTWTGALPSQPGFGTAALTAAAGAGTGAVSWLASYWPLVALGGVGLVWWLVKRK